MINIAKVCSIKFVYNVLSKNLEKIQPNAKMKYFVSKIYLIKIKKQFCEKNTILFHFWVN